jgi:glycosyltransferase involved in cell wall biosynthesis
MKLYFKSIDKIIVTSDNLAKTSNVLKNYQNKIEVIPLGIKLNKFLEQEKINFKKNKGDILFVGRLAPVKGIEYLVRAMKNIDANLNIVGKGPLKNKIEKMIRKNNLESKINLLGFVSDDELIDLYNKADIFVLPSIYRGEGFGYVLLEAMISKTACISTELGTGTSYINQNGKTGFVVPPKDSEALAEKINILIYNDHKLEKFKLNAFKRVKSRFSLERMFNDIGKVYQEVLEK